MSGVPPLRVLVVDDHPIVREGVRRILEAAPDMQVVGEASDAASALALAARLLPDAAVVDVGLPDMSGLALVRLLKEQRAELTVVMLSMYDDAEYARESRVAGASAYVVKDSAATMLATQLRLAVGARVGAPSHDEPPGPTPWERIAQLTPRECDVLRGIASGHTNKAIAAQFGISPRTVETHRERLMRKLGVSTVAGLTALALETGMLTAPDR
ncbi:MAG TPA: response regulator transcription factor [Gemmatimonadaceae bacterium]|nr:response regulator transcription factor [Gemmatimonadaceae bacterium]